MGPLLPQVGPLGLVPRPPRVLKRNLIPREQLGGTGTTPPPEVYNQVGSPGPAELEMFVKAWADFPAFRLDTLLRGRFTRLFQVHASGEGGVARFAKLCFAK